jgi:hypothetical protein
VRTRISALLPLLAFPAFSDTITVTLLDQTAQVTALAANYLGQTCNVSVSGLSASCNLPGTSPDGRGEVTSGASVSGSFGQFLDLHAEAGAGCCDAGGTASLRITDTVLISGGQGTGYLNVDFGFGQYGFSEQSSGSWNVQGQGSQGGSAMTFNFPGQIWGVATFQFGQPFTFSYAVFAGGDSSDPGGGSIDMSWVGARIYTSQPTHCGPDTASSTNPNWGLCSDPNFTSGDVLGDIYGVNAVPEPNSVWLALACVPLLPVIRRMGKDTRYFSSSARTVSMVSASSAFLSCLHRAMRGKRTAMPERWRGLS